MGVGVKMFTWTKVVGNLMKCLNPLKEFFSLFGHWGVKMFTWTKVAGNLMKCLNPLKDFFHCLGDGGIKNIHLNQSCGKFDEMPKSPKKISLSLFGWWGGFKMFTLTKVIGNLMKCLNPLKRLKKISTVWVMGRGIRMFTWTKVARNLMKCLNPLKNIFHCLADMGWGQNIHLNQSCRKFDEIPKSTKKIFFTVWVIGRGIKMFIWTKIAGNLMKCLNPLKKFLSLFGQWGWW